MTPTTIESSTVAAPPQHRAPRQARVLVVIPAYNEEHNVAKVIEDLRRSVPEYDRLVVNDGARDGTGRLLARMGERQLRLLCNLGYGRAIQTGLRYAVEHGYDIVVTFDADGQHRAADVPRLVQALLERDVDVVIGARFGRDRPYVGPLDRRIGQQLFSWLTARLTGQRVYDTTSGLKAIRSSACGALVDTVAHDFHMESLVMLCLSGYRVSEEPITVAQRAHGRSMHSVLSILTYPLQTMVVTTVALIDVGLRRRKR